MDDNFPTIHTNQKSNYEFVVSVLQNAKTHTEKLTALMILGKLLPSLDLNDEKKFKLLQLIGDQFLFQLLDHFYVLTFSHEDGDYENEFCIYITACFFPFITKQLLKKKFIKRLGEILYVLYEKRSSNPEIIGNILDCFDYINATLAAQKSYDYDLLNEVYSNHLIKCYLFENKIDLKNRIRNIITNFIGQSSKENANEIMEKICDLFVQENSINKFYLSDFINLILQTRSWKIEEIIQSNWIVKVRDELFILYKNRLNDELRDYVLTLTSELTFKCEGLDWIKLNKWEENNSKFFFLLLKLISIEIEIVLMQCLQNTTLHCGQKYATCLIVFENIFFTLVNNVDVDSEDQLKLNADEILSSIKSINETMLKIISFLKHLFLNEQDSVAEINPIAIASIRFLCLYALEEKKTFKKEISELRPFIMKLLNQNASEIQFIREQISAAMKLYDETKET